MEDQELQLVERAQQGDREAFKELVEAYQRKVYGICIGMLKNPDDSMDVSQEVFIKVYRYLEKFNRQSSFYTWLYRITVNMCIDFLRKKKRVQEVDYDDGILRGSDEVEGDEHILPSRLGLNPDRVYGRKELRQKMLEALETLSEKHRTILILREVEGLSYEEIADVLNISKGTVMSRLYHARRYFQAAVENYVGDELKVS
ncbi:RNA polymerase subunit sigma-24 [Lujinxingia litoralis]|uniref:RNA polymerase subunit sigma-24 n=1 Tax=Lujinxingia litoralis TaxID=2211119 RepID=A0A328C6B5_9DELT|nr:sigma-70 family RNA polymerase sigma factor [Lujinxingia litoralis]RAL21841.1 RNA polymerase subunit sigma-24 [Lujinxingia litoralis]